MSRLLVGSIDLNKIDKSKVVTTDKNGNPFSNGAKYYNIAVWINDNPDQYGNSASIQTSVSKEEKDNGIKGAYIGNLKDIQSNVNNTTVNEPVSVGAEVDDDLPFN